MSEYLANLLRRVWVPARQNPVCLDCIQSEHDTPITPLLPPDEIRSSSDLSCDGTPRSTKFREVSRARLDYNTLRTEKMSCRRLRKYVYGAVYHNLFQGYFEVDPLNSNYDLMVTLHSGKQSVIKIRLASPEEGVGKDNLLAAMVELGGALNFPGNSRGFRVGDIGAMHAIGLKSAASKEFFVIKERVSTAVRKASSLMREWLEDNMRDVLGEIVATDKKLNATYPPWMPRGPGSRLMVSVNLANSPHYDTGDTAPSIAIWVEKKPGQSKNWFFVLPNVSYNGSQGLVIKLVHGVVISWDGREIFHCTSETQQGKGNKTFGCMWTSSKP